MRNWDELWRFVSKSSVHVPFVKWMCRAGEDCESKVILREILVLDDIFFFEN